MHLSYPYYLKNQTHSPRLLFSEKGCVEIFTEIQMWQNWLTYGPQGSSNYRLTDSSDVPVQEALRAE